MSTPLAILISAAALLAVPADFAAGRASWPEAGAAANSTHPHPPCCKGCPNGPCTACRTPGKGACELKPTALHRLFYGRPCSQLIVAYPMAYPIGWQAAHACPRSLPSRHARHPTSAPRYQNRRATVPGSGCSGSCWSMLAGSKATSGWMRSTYSTPLPADGP